VSGYLPPAVNETWGTPQDLFDSLNAEFHFTLDAAASQDNTKCFYFYRKAQNSLTLPWTGNVWLNPPYGLKVGEWVKKAWDEVFWLKRARLVAMLLKATTETTWFHDWIWCTAEHRPYAYVDLRFIRGRLQFVIPERKLGPAPFSSMVVIFKAVGNE
jgi:phage N-6-adenine-methyltransferase